MQPYEILEQKIGKWMGVENVVACSSGTAALHLAFEALQLPQGTKVICPDYTMVACARAITLAGLTPVFVDCGDDLLMDDGDPMGRATVDPYSAFLAVHMYGRRCDMDWISSTAGVCHPIVEDMAELHGVRPHETTDAACWSFYKNKVVAGEEGGAVAFRNPEHAKLARQLRCLGFTYAHDFWHIPRGHNYRMSNLHAQPIIDSLNRFEANIGARRYIEAEYEKHCPTEWQMSKRDVPWVYDVKLPDDDAPEVVRALNAAGIAARQGFKPCSLQPEFRKSGQPELMSNARRLMNRIFYLPIQPGVTSPEDCRRAFQIAKDVLRA